jgi:hypothetical protein
MRRGDRRTVGRRWRPTCLRAMGIPSKRERRCASPHRRLNKNARGNPLAAAPGSPPDMQQSVCRTDSYRPGVGELNLAHAMALPMRSLMTSSSRSATSLLCSNPRNVRASDVSAQSAEKLRSGLSVGRMAHRPCAPLHSNDCGQVWFPTFRQPLVAASSAHPDARGRAAEREMVLLCPVPKRS